MKVEDDELVEAVKRIEGPYATAVEVSDEVGLSAEQTRERLRRLSGDILRSKDSGKMVGYWVR